MSATGPARRVLLVAYYYPPRPIIGGRRPHALAKHLRRRGHEVTVLTSVVNAGGAAPADVPAPAAGRELRARDLLATPLNWRRSQGAGTANAPEVRLDATPGLWGSLFVPDVQLLSWLPFATAAADREARRRRPDVVVTTSPVESAHLVGLALRRRHGIPWVADLRDGWRFEAPKGEWRNAAQRRLDDALERGALTGADALVTVSEPLSADLRERLGTPVETITNGYDPDDVAAAEAPAGAVSPDRFTLVYTGGLGSKQTLRPVLDALGRLNGDRDAPARPAELVIAGAQTEEERLRLEAEDVRGLVRTVGILPHREALGLQSAADLLVVVTSGARRGEVTGKLLEYLAAGPPILVLGDESEAAAIVLGAGAGWAVPVRDADAAEAVLRRILAGERPAAGTGAGRAAYSYAELAARYERVLEQAIRGGAAPR